MTTPTESEPTPQERAEMAGQRLNDLLHADLGVDEPCDYGCTHFLSADLAGLSLLGIANVFARAVERHLSDSGRPSEEADRG